MALTISIEKSDPEFIARIEWLAEVRKKAADGSWKLAANNLSSGLDEVQPFGTEQAAEDYVRSVFYRLLNEDRYLEAGTLAWRQGHFDARPLHVQRIFKCLHDYDQCILIGSAGTGKTMGTATHFVLDFIRDPFDTTIKIASVNDENLRTNLWSKIVGFMEASLFPLAFEASPTRMRLKPEGGRADAGISAVLLGRGIEAKGAVKGLHPTPLRKKPHPVWGDLTRIRLLVDESMHTPAGLLEDLGSPRSSINPRTHAMKIVLTCNAVSEDNWVLQEAQPKDGWREEMMDELYDWDSPKGWRVCRMDSRTTENVVQRRTVYPGFPEKEAEKQYLNGVTTTARWFTFFAGWPPIGRANDVVISPSWFDQALGEPIFVGHVTAIGGFDPAYDHDKAMLAIGKYGLASGWLAWDGTVHQFNSRTSDTGNERRHCCVLEQLIHLKSKDPVNLAKEVRAWCERAGVTPEFLAGDRSGNGVGTTGHINAYWDKMIAINAKQAASAYRILAEDSEGADIQCRSATDEMYYTIRRWIPSGVRGLFIRPDADNLEFLKHELTTRGWRYGTANQWEVEPKEKYTKRGNESPGCFVAGTMVSTVNGDISIEDVKIGDVVKTPFGTSPVIATHELSSRSLVKFTTNLGTTLIGTPDHMVFTREHGWVRMDRLGIDTTMESVWMLPAWDLLRACFTKVRSSGFKQAVLDISPATKPFRREFFIESSGSSTTGLFLKVMMCITRIATGQTIGSRILKRCRTASTSEGITRRTGKITRFSWLRRWLPLPKLERPPNPGILPRLAWSGIDNTPRHLFQIAGDIRGCALFAGSRGTLFSKTQKRALGYANHETATESGTRLMRYVKFAIALLRPIKISRVDIVPGNASVSSTGASQSTPVYDITLLEHNAYYANGVLVQNCSDALGHMVLVPRLRGMQLPAMVDEQVVAKKRNPNGSPKHPDQVSYATASIGGNVRWTKPELNGGDVVVPSDWNLKLR